MSLCPASRGLCWQHTGAHSSLLGLRGALRTARGCTQGRCHKHWVGPSTQNLLFALGAPSTAQIPSVGQGVRGGKAPVWKQRGLRSLRTDPSSCIAPLKSSHPYTPCAPASVHMGLTRTLQGERVPVLCLSPSPPAPTCSSVPTGCSHLC